MNWSVGSGIGARSLTEVPTHEPIGRQRVASPLTRPPRVPGRPLESWVAIEAADGIEMQTVKPEISATMSVTALVDVPGGPGLLIFGSVLPWRNFAHHASDLLQLGETSKSAFARILREQVDEMAVLRRSHPGRSLIWAGDFNQSVVGYNGTGTTMGRFLLQDSLDELGLDAWNMGTEHRRPGMSTIDLICGPSECPVIRASSISTPGLSDHDAYFVTVEI